MSKAIQPWHRKAASDCLGLEIVGFEAEEMMAQAIADAEPDVPETTELRDAATVLFRSTLTTDESYVSFPIARVNRLRAALEKMGG